MYMNILWFKDCSYENKQLVGGKNASLGASFWPPNAPVKISCAAFFSFRKWDGKSAPKDDRTLDADEVRYNYSCERGAFGV